MKSILRVIKDKIKETFPGTWKYFKDLESFIQDFLENIKWRMKYLFFDLKRGHFSFQNSKMRYFTHRYNWATLNERTIEVPIIYNIIKKYRGKNILEIGNVLSHYFNSNWDILDKFEKGKNVINEDIVDFKPQGKYDLVVSISTFEHIGYDYGEDKDSSKCLSAINYVRANLIDSKSLFIMTIPLGYNINIDKKLFAGELYFDRIYWFRRISYDNRWEGCKKEDIVDAKYNLPFKWANAIAICTNTDLIL